jgi:hypothetical protein
LGYLRVISERGGCQGLSFLGLEGTENVKLKTKTMLGVAISLCLLLALSSVFIPTTEACRGRKTFIVRPLGDGQDDSANIQAAFDMAADAGPGSTVRLTKGIFYLHNPIVAVNFDGTFKGAGMEKTQVLVPDNIELPMPSGDNPGGLARIFLFYHTPDYPMSECNPAYLGISDLSIRVEGKAALWDFAWFTDIDWLNAIDIVGKYTGIADDTPTYLNVYCTRVRIEGLVGEFAWGINVNNGLQLLPGVVAPPGGFAEYFNPFYGTILVTNCEFINPDAGFVFAGSMVDSTILFYKNRLYQSGTGFLGDFSNSKILLFGNSWENIIYAIWMEQAVGWSSSYIPELSKLWVFCNTFDGVEDPMDVIIVYDYGLWEDPPVTSLETHIFWNWIT